MSEKEKINQLKSTIEEFSHKDKTFQDGVVMGMYYSLMLFENGKEYADKRVKFSQYKAKEK